MTAIATQLQVDPAATVVTPDHLLRRLARSNRVIIGTTVLGLILIACLVTLPWALSTQSPWHYDAQNPSTARMPPASSEGLWRLFGTDMHGRSLLSRCLLGGLISLGIGIAAAGVSVVLGVAVGLVAGYRGGWVDSLLMRIVDVLYGLPYILIVILLKIALERPLIAAIEWLVTTDQGLLLNARLAANVVVLFLAIGCVAWLTMARVVRGQVLSLRTQPFIEAARAAGLTETRIFITHLLPNMVGPILVYATLTVPRAILEESFLSFLGVGINPPLPTWGALASEGLMPALNPIESRWWLLTFPCLLLAVTLLCLNFLGDGLRDVLDPKRDVAKI